MPTIAFHQEYRTCFKVVISFCKKSSFLFSTILCAVEVCPHHVFSQDFQDQAIPGQEAKTQSSHSSMDSNENWQ